VEWLEDRTLLASATTLVVTVLPNSSTPGPVHAITVTAEDRFGNIDTNYGGTVHFASSDPQAVLPHDSTLSNGQQTFTASLPTVGDQTLTVTDTANSAITGGRGVMTEFSVPTANSAPDFITGGSDGNLWFTEEQANKIGRIAPAGGLTEFSVPTPNSLPQVITLGPDGAAWFIEFNANKIGRIAPTGTITEYAVPTLSSGLADITAGPDGNLWFTEAYAGKIAKITPSGVFTEYSTGGDPAGITQGPDGNLWFTDFQGAKIGRIRPSGAVTEFPLSSVSGLVSYITTGPDGNLWFTEGVGRIGQITTTGKLLHEFPTGGTPSQITTDANGNVWYVELTGNQLDRITPAGVITTFAIPTAGSSSYSLANGPDGNLWFAESNGNNIGRFTLPITVPPAPLLSTVSSSGGTTTITGTLLSEPNTTFVLKFYSNQTRDPSFYGQGQNYIGFATVTTDANGHFAFTANQLAGLPAGLLYISATATDSNGNTSQFALDLPTIRSVYYVTNTLDSGSGSLRAAIMAADADPYSNIDFNIPASDPNHFYYKNDGIAGHVSLADIATTTATDDSQIPNIDPDWPHSWWEIQPFLPLNSDPSGANPSWGPSLTEPVSIDGYSQPGASRNTLATGDNAVLRIELNGGAPNAPALLSVASAAADAGGGGALLLRGLSIETHDTTISGLVINGYDQQQAPAINNLGDTYAAYDFALVANNQNQVISGNFIGTDVSGTMAVPNAVGMSLMGAQYSRIGMDANNTGWDQRNIISGNAVFGATISTDAEGNILAGNLIGVDKNGNALPNGSPGVSGTYFSAPNQSTTFQTNGAGVFLDFTALNSQIGGPGALANTIADNAGPGVWVASELYGRYAVNSVDPNNLANPNDMFYSSGNRIEGNSIFGNGGNGQDGIFLGGTFDVFTFLFSYDDSAGQIQTGPDSVRVLGPNDLQDFPVLTSAVTNKGGNTIIAGSFSSPSQPNTSITVDFYANAAADPSGYGEGQIYLGSLTFTTNSSGVYTIHAFKPSVTVPVGYYITATATDPTGNTSEFGPDVLVTSPKNATHGMAQMTASSGSSDSGASGGALVPEDLNVYVDDSNGAFTADQLAAMNNAISGVAALVSPYGVQVTEVTDPCQADFIVSMSATSELGGVGQGVLGVEDSSAGTITMIQGWNWYAGSDPAQIGLAQFDFQTTVTHELGHALGLGESSNTASAMSGTLNAGTTIRTLTSADLNVPHDKAGADGQHAALPATNETSTAATTVHSSASVMTFDVSLANALASLSSRTTTNMQPAETLTQVSAKVAQEPLASLPPGNAVGPNVALGAQRGRDWFFAQVGDNEEFGLISGSKPVPAVADDATTGAGMGDAGDNIEKAVPALPQDKPPVREEEMPLYDEAGDEGFWTAAFRDTESQIFTQPLVENGTPAAPAALALALGGLWAVPKTETDPRLRRLLVTTRS
jgi:streptogramin lyase